MHDHATHAPSDAFLRCWLAARRHLQTQDASLRWLRMDRRPAYLEDLSFCLGNQLFFICLEDQEGCIRPPENPNGVLSVADAYKGHACLMPMKCVRGEWVPSKIGWGLVEAGTRRAINPPDLVTGQNIEMTDRDLHYCAVQLVCEHIEKELGYRLIDWQENPKVDPSIWSVGDNGPEWVVVRAVRHPDPEATLPMSEIAEICAQYGSAGHFASVSFANVNDMFDKSGRFPALPLWREDGMYPRFTGLEPAIVH